MQMVAAVPYLSLSVALDRDCLGGWRTCKYRERIDFGAHEATGHEFLGGGGRLAECKRTCGVAHDIKPRNGWIDVGEIVAAEIRDRELSEDIVKDRGGVLDGVIALHGARRFKASEREGVNIFLERHAVLQADRDRDREIVHERAEGGALLVHVDEDLPETAVAIFAGAEIDLAAADAGFLCVAFAPIRQAFASLRAFDEPFNDPLADDCGAGRDIGSD